MPELKETAGKGLIPGPPVEEEKRTCPACGAVREKTTPTLADVRKAIQEEIRKFENDLHRLDPQAELGYRGSVARGTVGNPNKPHVGLEPDITGECGTKFDVDAFVISAKLCRKVKPDRFGKRWAKFHRDLRQLEARICKALNGRPELQHMTKGKAGFEILLRHPKERAKLGGGGMVMLI